MSVEDFWWEAHNTLQKLKLQRKFDKQLKKMKFQEKGTFFCYNCVKRCMICY